MEVSADHLFAVNGVEAGQKALPSSLCVTVLQGVCKVCRLVLH